MRYGILFIYFIILQLQALPLTCFYLLINISTYLHYMVPVSVCISFGRFTRNVSANNDGYTTFPFTQTNPHVMYSTITCVIYVRGCILNICIRRDENSIDSRDSTPASMNKARSVETIGSYRATKFTLACASWPLYSIIKTKKKKKTLGILPPRHQIMWINTVVGAHLPWGICGESPSSSWQLCS